MHSPPALRLSTGRINLQIRKYYRVRGLLTKLAIVIVSEGSAGEIYRRQSIARVCEGNT